MQILTIDLTKNPDVKDLVQAMQPGDRVALQTSIKSKDDQTLTLTLEEAEEGRAKEEDGESTDADDEEGQDEGDGADKMTDVTPGRAPNSGGDGGKIAAALQSSS